MVELVVGMVGILAVCAGLLQLSSLTRTHTDVFVEARRRAGQAAMLDLGAGGRPSSDPHYIYDWQEGPDERRHTRDDILVAGSPSAFTEQIVARLSQDEEGWDVLQGIPGDDLQALRNGGNPVAWFGLVRGHAAQRVDLLPAVQHLLYASEDVEVECEVWMTWTKGLY